MPKKTLQQQRIETSIKTAFNQCNTTIFEKDLDYIEPDPNQPYFEDSSSQLYDGCAVNMPVDSFW